MERCFSDLLGQDEPDRSVRLNEELIPSIVLNPPPHAWPDLAELEDTAE